MNEEQLRQWLTEHRIDEVEENVVDPVDRDMITRPDLATLRLVPFRALHPGHLRLLRSAAPACGQPGARDRYCAAGDQLSARRSGRTLRPDVPVQAHRARNRHAPRDLCHLHGQAHGARARHLSAPINLQWGYDNRTVGLRVPHSDADNRRIENRLAGADVNPYLAIAASLACGLLGLHERLEPTAPEAGSAYNRPFALPGSLSDALRRFEQSEQLRPLLGERFIKIYTAMKRQEYQAFFEVISPWEREYLLLNV